MRFDAGSPWLLLGDYHLLLRRAGSGYAVELQQGPQVCYQRPSVDVMFASVARAAGSHGVGVLLTGMGTDGAKGLLALRRAGAATIAQDEPSCVVYGMPREARRLDAAVRSSPLADIPGSWPGPSSSKQRQPPRQRKVCSTSSAAGQRPKQRGEGMQGTVLVVDDSAMMRKVVLRVLKMADVEFEAAWKQGGNEAIALLRANKVNFIMCDINMPGHVRPAVAPADQRGKARGRRPHRNGNH